MTEEQDLTEVWYRQLFTTELGQRVLANILAEAKFFECPKTLEELAVMNFAKGILCKCGCFDNNKANKVVKAIIETARVD